MTREEFSNMFTTLLNSHSNRAGFGEGNSKTDIVLDSGRIFRHITGRQKARNRLWKRQRNSAIYGVLEGHSGGIRFNEITNPIYKLFKG